MDIDITTTCGREHFGLMGATAAPLATGEQTGHAWELIQLDVAPGGRSPLHTIASDKLFYVLGGEMTIVAGDAEHRLGAGACVHVPAGTPHCYRNEADVDGALLVLATGSGHVGFLRGMSDLTAGGPPDRAALAAHTARHGVTILQPARA